MWVSAVQKSWCCVFICLCSEEVSRHGFTVIVDMRGSKWDSIKPLLKILQESFPSCIHIALIIKPDNFWQKQRTNFGSSKFEFEVRTLCIVNLHLITWQSIRSSVSVRYNIFFLKSVVWDYRIFQGNKLKRKHSLYFTRTFHIGGVKVELSKLLLAYFIRAERTTHAVVLYLILKA